MEALMDANETRLLKTFNHKNPWARAAGSGFKIKRKANDEFKSTYEFTFTAPISFKLALNPNNSDSENGKQLIMNEINGFFYSDSDLKNVNYPTDQAFKILEDLDTISNTDDGKAFVNAENNLKTAEAALSNANIELENRNKHESNNSRLIEANAALDQANAALDQANAAFEQAEQNFAKAKQDFIDKQTELTQFNNTIIKKKLFTKTKAKIEADLKNAELAFNTAQSELNEAKIATATATRKVDEANQQVIRITNDANKTILLLGNNTNESKEELEQKVAIANDLVTQYKTEYTTISSSETAKNILNLRNKLIDNSKTRYNLRAIIEKCDINTGEPINITLNMIGDGGEMKKSILKYIKYENPIPGDTFKDDNDNAFVKIVPHISNIMMFKKHVTTKYSNKDLFELITF